MKKGQMHSKHPTKGLCTPKNRTSSKKSITSKEDWKKFPLARGQNKNIFDMLKWCLQSLGDSSVSFITKYKKSHAGLTWHSFR